MKPKKPKKDSPLDRLRHHVSGAIARGEAKAVAEIPTATALRARTFAEQIAAARHDDRALSELANTPTLTLRRALKEASDVQDTRTLQWALDLQDDRGANGEPRYPGQK